MFKGMEIAASGLAAQRTRLHIVGSNLANASTTRTEEGGPYRRKEAVFETAFPLDPEETRDEGGKALRSVRVAEVRRDPSPGPKVYDPSHPDADADGEVEMPNVNPVEEMVDMITASRSFEANAQSFQTLRQMSVRALEIGR